MSRMRVSLVGASGYAGGDLLRILLGHPEVEVVQATSERFAGKPVTRVHPNLRGVTKLSFSRVDDLEPVDLLFLSLPHRHSAKRIDAFSSLAGRIIDLSADFRLNDSAAYQKWYGEPHPCPERLSDFVYGIPELHREEMRTAAFVSSAGCNATATILGVYPLFAQGVVDTSRTVVEVKAGSSEGGNKASEASHHPERSGCVRSFKPTGHRHVAEMIQELGGESSPQISFSATSIEMVRGILATAHVFLTEELEEKDIWKIYRQAYQYEPFIRIVKDRSGIYRYPEPKLLAGTNWCDIGFERDPDSNRVVVMSAIDNLMKGAAGQAVQAMNIMCGFDERLGLEFVGLHPA